MEMRCNRTNRQVLVSLASIDQQLFCLLCANHRCVWQGMGIDDINIATRCATSLIRSIKIITFCSQHHYNSIKSDGSIRRLRPLTISSVHSNWQRQLRLDYYWPPSQAIEIRQYSELIAVCCSCISHPNR